MELPSDWRIEDSAAFTQLLSPNDELAIVFYLIDNRLKYFTPLIEPSTIDYLLPQLQSENKIFIDSNINWFFIIIAGVFF